MKNLNVFNRDNSFKAIALLLILTFSACSKGGDSPSPSPTPTPPVVVSESDIAFKVDIAGSEVNYTNVFAVVGLLL